MTASSLRALVRIVTAFINRRSAQEIVLEGGGKKVVIKGSPGRTERALANAWIEHMASAHEVVTRDAGDGSSHTRDEG